MIWRLSFSPRNLDQKLYVERSSKIQHVTDFFVRWDRNRGSFENPCKSFLEIQNCSKGYTDLSSWQLVLTTTC